MEPLSGKLDLRLGGITVQRLMFSNWCYTDVNLAKTRTRLKILVFISFYFWRQVGVGGGFRVHSHIIIRCKVNILNHAFPLIALGSVF